VGGSGVSAIAEVLVRSGFIVTGSDEQSSDVTARLAGMGVTVHRGHAARHVGSADVVVMSSAVRATNVEVLEARGRGIPVIRRGEMLAEIMRPRFGIAVAGAHGKTTTTAMVALMLEHAGLDPTALIGGYFAPFGGNARLGRSDYVVAEADESDRSFLGLSPCVAVITNLDREHLQSYASFEELTGAFVTFANRVPFFGAAVVCVDDPVLSAARPGITARVVTYGLDREDADVTAGDVRLEGDASTLTVIVRESAARRAPAGELRLAVPGRHNVRNALAAVAVGRELGLDFASIAAGLAAFPGTARRYERIGHAGGVTVVDDYGHHPTEIRTVIETARRASPGRVVVVFQPHRYTRTQQLRDDFGAALGQADEVVLADIYASGEEPIPGVTIEWLAEAVERHVPGRVRTVPALADVPRTVAAIARPGDLVVTLGAGSIGEYGRKILDEIRR
jgi:UDP-N-acetylmuramate--alanine ligase